VALLQKEKQMHRKISAIALLVALSSVGAQDQESNWAIGPHLIFSFPQSEFANVSKTGEGLGGKVTYRLPFARALSLRSDLVYLSYAERKDDIFYMDYYTVAQTRNESFQFTLGLQASERIGSFTPYLAWMNGLYNYRSVVSFQDSYYYGYGYADTKESQTKWGWNANAGLLWDIGIGPHIDLNFRYQTIWGTMKNKVENTSERHPKDLSVTLGVVFFLNRE